MYNKSVSVIFEPHDLNKLNMAVAQAVLSRMQQLATSQQFVVVGLCGGHSPVGVYQNLVTVLNMSEPTFLCKLQFFLVDERVTDRIEKLNYTVVYDQLLAPLIEKGKIGSDQCHNFHATGREAPQELKAKISFYSNRLQQYGNKFDIVILGVGEDGHCAGLFPKHNSVNNTSDGYISFDKSPKPPAVRMSASVSLLKRSGMGVLLFLGREKKNALKKYVKEGGIIEEVPCKVANEMSSCVVAIYGHSKEAQDLWLQHAD